MPRAEPDLLTPHLLRAWPLPVPDDGGSKHDRGTVHVVGGAPSTPGAVLLAALAALRVGAGRLQVTTVPETSVALGVTLPEAAVQGSADLATAGASPADAVVLGPGLLDDGDLERVVAGVARDATGGLVVDAVALTRLPPTLPERCVLTPNAGELRALVGEGEDADLVVEASSRYGVVVATHGWVAAPDGRRWRNETGNVGLGTSGSGDVLSGAVGGLLARGADPAQAACWGLYLHAVAGDRLAERLGRLGFLARELLDELPRVLAGLGR
ncbi:MAG: NAD(P)H-hydrate dehydratase [Mycobacteriales bacterium]